MSNRSAFHRASCRDHMDTFGRAASPFLAFWLCTRQSDRADARSSPNIFQHTCRCIAVHPVLPYILSSSDDMLIKLWDWDKVRPG